MQGFLKQSTASQVRSIGPFVDDVDFVTLEDGLTINNTDIVISKNGAADVTKNSGGATAHGAGGLYTLTWDATDTDTVGELIYSVKVPGALVVFGTYHVLEEQIYDAFYAANATGSEAIYRGSITGASPTTTTLVDSALTQADTDHWKGRIVIFVSGALKYQATDITGFTPASDTLTFTALTSAPAQNDLYVIV